jgi:carboxymethylenebutenolidase
VTRRLAKLGAFAVAPDYYFRKGDLTKITDIQQLLPLVNSKPDDELLSDLDATVAWAKSQGGDTTRLGIIGFCRGGRTVWEYAVHNGALKAGVGFYGPPVDPTNPLWPKSPTQLAPEMKAPVLGLYGEADTGIPVAQVEALKAALAANHKTAEFKIYPARRTAYRASYRKEAAEDAGNQMQAFQEIQRARLSAEASRERVMCRPREGPSTADEEGSVTPAAAQCTLCFTI